MLSQHPDSTRPLRAPLCALILLIAAMAAAAGCDGDLTPPEELPDDPTEYALCTDEPASFPPRPLWSEVRDGSGVPDYQNVTSNLNVLDSLQLFASMLEKAVQSIDALDSSAGEAATGTCLCNCVATAGGIDLATMPADPAELDTWAASRGTDFVDGCFEQNLSRAACQQKCDDAAADTFAASAPAAVSGHNYLWILSDVLTLPSGDTTFAFELVAFLDSVNQMLSGDSPIATAVDALSATGGEVTQRVRDIIDALADINALVDRFTEGFHLGGYSTQRPDLHMCVGWAGHGAYAQLGNLGGDKVSIGARYTSHQLSYERRAQFRSGGFGAQAYGSSLSLLPSIEANLQIDGFKLWNADKPFGLQIPDGSAIATSNIDDYDIFRLVDDPDQVRDLAGNDGAIDLPGDLLVSDYYPGEYTSDDDGETYTWPRSMAADDSEWMPWTGWDGEQTSTAVFSAGLNLPIEIEPIDMELPGIPIFPPFATLTPSFGLAAGVEWIHENFRLRDRIRDKVNENIPDESQHLSDDDFARDMHALQAPDVSEDLGTTAFVEPELGATLDVGLNLASFIRLGVGASLGFSLEVAPGGWGGLVDLNYALVEMLRHSNPPPEAQCEAVWTQNKDVSCSNERIEASTASLACSDDADSSCCVTIGDRRTCIDDWTGITADTCNQLNTLDSATEGRMTQIRAWLDRLRAHLDAATVETLLVNLGEATPVGARWNRGSSCATADCNTNLEPRPLESLSTCEKHGYCIDGNDNVIAHDVTREFCESGEVDGTMQSGRCCYNYEVTRVASEFNSVKCPLDRSSCDAVNGTFIPGGVCTAGLDRTDCSNPNDPEPSPAQQRIWLPYTCTTTSTPELAGWEGPGCHPMEQGFPSACGCQSDTDCAPGESCNADGICEGSSGYACTCDSDGSSCETGRTCVDGACFLECASSDECPSGRGCDAGICRPEHEIPTAEEIIHGVRNGVAPLHAISTYALSEILFAPALSFTVDAGLKIKFFFGSKNLKIFKWEEIIDLGSTNKSWYQPGLEAQYQNQCSPDLLQPVTNRMPRAQTLADGLDIPSDGAFNGFVDRYPDPLPMTPLDPDDTGNACNPTSSSSQCSWRDLVAWCEPQLEGGDAIRHPPAPTEQDLADSFTQTFEWGRDIGLQVWESQQVCIDGQVWHQWAQNRDGSLENRQCRYESPTGTIHVFPCSESIEQLTELWGCLNTSRSSAAQRLTLTFGSSITKNNGQTFDIDSMVIDPDRPMTWANLRPAIRYESFLGQSVGRDWMRDVESCFDAQYAAESTCGCTADDDCTGDDATCNAAGECVESTGQLAICPVIGLAEQPDVQPCCGDGQIQGGEECDDGNTDGGDGCSSYCTLDDGLGKPGACCDGQQCRESVNFSTCNDLGGIFHRNQTCSEVGCGIANKTGACCDGNTCLDNILGGKCQDISGTFTAGATCEEVACDGGACCLSSQCTEEASEAQCRQFDGKWFDLQRCSAITCP